MTIGYFLYWTYLIHFCLYLFTPFGNLTFFYWLPQEWLTFLNFWLLHMTFFFIAIATYLRRLLSY